MKDNPLLPFGSKFPSFEEFLGGTGLLESLGGEGIAVSLNGSDPGSVLRALGQIFPEEQTGASPRDPENSVFAYAKAFRILHHLTSEKIGSLQALAATIVSNRRIAKVAKNAPKYVAAVQTRIDGITETDAAALEYRARLQRDQRRFSNLSIFEVNDLVAGLMAHQFSAKVEQVNRGIANLQRQYESACSVIDSQLGQGVSAALNLPNPLEPVTEKAIWKKAREMTDAKFPSILQQIGISELPVLPAPTKKPKLTESRSRRRSPVPA